jgi:hypothetical protein
MLVKINIKGSKAELIPKIEKMSGDDCLWMVKKLRDKPQGAPIEMDLPEVIRLLTAFNKVEKIYFEVR